MDKFAGMNEFLREKLRAPTMTAHDAPDGGDVQLADAAQALADGAADFPYTPPMPVPVSEMVHRPDGQPGMKSQVFLATPTTIANAVGSIGKLVAGGNADNAMDFPINSIMVDNFTVAWAHWPEVGVWVPPFNFGRVFRFNGSHNAKVRFESPPQLVNAVTPGTSQSSQICRVQFFEEFLPENTGIVLPTTNQ